MYNENVNIIKMGVHSMKMKRFIAIVMALFLVLAGCSNSNDNNESKKMTQTMVRNKRFKLQRQQV